MKMIDEKLAMVIDAAKKIDELTETKDEFGGLPVGHPFRVAMEKAKEKYEENLKKKKETEEKVKIKKAKKVKILNKRNEEEKEIKNKKNIRSLNILNRKLEEMVKITDDFEKEIKKISNLIDEEEYKKEVDLKLARLKRIFDASKRAILESRIDTRQMKMES